MPWIQIGIIVIRYSMDADKELSDAVDRRIEREGYFKQEIIDKINSIISELAFCDPANAASTLNLSQKTLREVIEKLNDIKIIDADSSASISDILTTKNLRRAPEVATPGTVPAAPVAPLPATPCTVPATHAAPLPAGRRPVPPEASPPAAPGLTLQQRKENWINRGRNAVSGFQNTNPPVVITQTPTMGGRRTRRRRKTRR